jgi:hypothetical protein
MLSAECQSEKRDLAIDISLLYEFESKMLTERFPWKQAENRNKTLQEDRIMIMRRERETLVSVCITNTHNRILSIVKYKLIYIDKSSLTREFLRSF